jgi:hypothetical protein
MYGPLPFTAADHQASGGGKQADAVRDEAKRGAFRIEALVVMREAAPSQRAECLHGTRSWQTLRNGCEEQMDALREGLLLWPRWRHRPGRGAGGIGGCEPVPPTTESNACRTSALPI